MNDQEEEQEFSCDQALEENGALQRRERVFGSKNLITLLSMLDAGSFTRCV